MKTLYSSTFLSAILAFLILLGQSGNSVNPVQEGSSISFRNIIEPVGPQILPPEVVKLEVFTTFGCRDCDNFGLGTLPLLVEKYAESEAVDFHLYLIPDVESEGERYATRGAHCAAEYEGFWKMVSELHGAETLSKRDVDLVGQDLEFPVLPFRDCLDSESFDPKIGEDLEYAKMKNISRKPTIMVNGTLLLGNQPIENIEYYVDRLLSR